MTKMEPLSFHCRFFFTSYLSHTHAPPFMKNVVFHPDQIHPLIKTTILLFEGGVFIFLSLLWMRLLRQLRMHERETERDFVFITPPNTWRAINTWGWSLWYAKTYTHLITITITCPSRHPYTQFFFVSWVLIDPNLPPLPRDAISAAAVTDSDYFISIFTIETSERQE